MPKTVSIHAVNVLFLIVLVLVAVVGTLLQQLSTGVGLLLTELLLILLPALLFLRREKLPFLQSVRFNFPGFRVIFLALAAGAGLTFFSAMLAAAVTQLLKYTFQMPEGMFSTEPVNALLVFTSLAVLAPICEEILFRGVILPAYERYGALRAILLVGFTFALFHMSLVRMLALIPVALVLTWLAWRTRSVVSSMLMHFSYNWISAAALFMVSVFGGGDALARAAAGSPATLETTLVPGLFGLLIGALALVGIELVVRHGHSPSALLPAAPAAETRLPLRNIWALLLAVVLGLGIATADMLLTRDAQAQAQDPLTLSPGNWDETARWEYVIRNKGGENVGSATCGRASLPEGYRFYCITHQDAFSLQLGQSYYQSEAYDGRSEAYWSLDDLSLLKASGSRSGKNYDLTYSVLPGEGGLRLEAHAQGETAPSLIVPAAALLEDDWAWRFQGAEMARGFTRNASLAFPLTYVEAEQSSRPLLLDDSIRVVGQETIQLRSGETNAWKVTFDKQTAWYAVDNPHTLLMLDNGMVVLEYWRED